MLRIVVLISLLLVIISCQPQPESECEQDGSECSETTNHIPAPELDPLPEDEISNDAMIFDANIRYTNFEREDEEKVQAAIVIIQKVIQSKEFRERVINFTYDGKKQFVDNGGLSNGQIYQILLNGSEDLLVGIDHEMDLELELYKTTDNVVGYTYPNILKIFMNRKYFDVYTPTEVAGNIFHEWTHKLGFEHAFQYSQKRDSSVPYALGYLIEELGVKYEQPQ